MQDWPYHVTKILQPTLKLVKIPQTEKSQKGANAEKPDNQWNIKSRSVMPTICIYSFRHTKQQTHRFVFFPISPLPPSARHRMTNALHKNTDHWIREFCSWLKCKNGVFRLLIWITEDRLFEDIYIELWIQLEGYWPLLARCLWDGWQNRIYKLWRKLFFGILNLILLCSNSVI